MCYCCEHLLKMKTKENLELTCSICLRMQKSVFANSLVPLVKNWAEGPVPSENWKTSGTSDGNAEVRARNVAAAIRPVLQQASEAASSK